MTDIVLRIQSAVGQAVADVSRLRTAIAETGVTTKDFREQWQRTTAEVIADTRKQIAAEKEKVAQYRQEITAIGELTSSYKKGSEERQILTQREIELQRKLQASLGETAAVARKTGKEQSAAAEESSFLRGAASRSGVAGTGMAALAGPGFIAGAVIGGGLDYAVHQAEDAQTAQANLRNSLKDSNVAWAANRKEIEDNLKQQEDLTGFDRDQLTQTLSQLIRSTGSLTKAQQDEAVMANIARARHTDLQGAMMLVLRASEGNVGALRRLGIDIPKVTTHVDQLRKAHLSSNVELAKQAKALDLAATKTRVMEEVTKRFAGSGAAYMKTFAGEEARFHNVVHDLFVELGEKAIPILADLFGWLSKEIEVAKQSKGVHQALADVVKFIRLEWDGLVTVVQIAHGLMQNKLIRTLVLVTAGVWALNTAVSANPWVAAAVAALLAVAEIKKHWDRIRDFFKALWVSLKDGFKLLWDDLVMLALKAAAKIVEPFSHLPGKLGKWARDAKDNIHDEYVAMQKDAAAQGQAISDAWGQAFNTGIQNAVDKASVTIQQALSGGPGGAGLATAPGQLKGVGGGSIRSAGGMDMVASAIISSGKGFIAETPGGSVLLPKAINKSGGGGVALAAAHAIGIQYSWGGGGAGGPSTGIGRGANTVGFDCSGLAQFALSQAGVTNVPRSSQEQFSKAPYHPAVNELEPGDLVFYEGPHPGHVAVYIGDGKVVHAPHTGVSVQIASVNMMKITGTGRYWGGKTQTAGTPTKKPAPKVSVHTGADTSGFDAAVEQAQAAAAAAKAAKAGLKAPSLIGLQGSIDAELRALPKTLDPVEKEAVAQIKKIRDSLHIGMSQTELAKDKVDLARWAKTLRDEIHKNGAGLTKTSLIGLQGSIAAELKALPADLDPVEKEAVRHIKELRDKLHVGMSGTDLAKTKVELARWGKTLKDEIKKQLAEAKAAAAEAAKNWTAGWDANVSIIGRQITEAWSLVQRDFDRETTSNLTAMQRDFATKMRDFDRDTQAHITQMQRDFAKQMVTFDRETQTELDKMQVAQTPEEKAYQDFVDQRAAQDQSDRLKTLRDNLAQAQQSLAAGGGTMPTGAGGGGNLALLTEQGWVYTSTSGSLETSTGSSLTDLQQAVVQAQKDLDNELADEHASALKDAADTSRAAADTQTAIQQQAYQDQRDSQKQGLQDIEDGLEQSYNDQRDVTKQGLQDLEDLAEQHYQDERASQWQHLQDMHDDQIAMFDADLKLWQTALTNKKKTWAQFLGWLQGNPISKGLDGGAITDPGTFAITDPTAGGGVTTGGGGRAIVGKAIPTATGGVHLRPTVRMLGEQGPEATVPLSGQQGQAAIAQLARAIVTAAGGGIGGGTTIYGTFLGATEKQVGRALEGLVTPQQARVVRYKAPI